MAKDEYGLTPNQRAFADEYIANKGNATRAYLKAYPNTKKEQTAAVNANRTLRNDKVAKYIADQTAEMLEKAKMNGQEIIIELSKTARREQVVSYSKQYDHLSGDVIKEITYYYQPTIEEATKAMELLIKFLGMDDPLLDAKRRKLEAEARKIEGSMTVDTSQTDRLAEYIEGLKEVYEDDS